MKKTLLLNIKSNVAECFWNIDTENELDQKDINFIKNFNPAIYHTDVDCYLWAFDEKLPSGRWLENIRFSNDLKTANAIIF